MNPELREAVGKAAYAVLERDLHHPVEWDKLDEEKREITRRAAEAAVETYRQWMQEYAIQGPYFNISGLGS